MFSALKEIKVLEKTVELSFNVTGISKFNWLQWWAFSQLQWCTVNYCGLRFWFNIKVKTHTFTIIVSLPGSQNVYFIAGSPTLGTPRNFVVLAQNESAGKQIETVCCFMKIRKEPKRKMKYCFSQIRYWVWSMPQKTAWMWVVIIYPPMCVWNAKKGKMQISI